MLTVMTSKAVALLGLGGGSFVLGVLPLWFQSRHHRWPLLMSVLLCFGAGVLLATAIIHMLPEVRESIGTLAEPAFCGGFFLLYLVDELVHFCWTREVDNTMEAESVSPTCSHSHHNAQYGSTDHDNVATFMHRPSTTPTTSLLCHTTFKEPCPNSPIGRVGLLVALTVHSALEGMAIGLQASAAEVLLLVGAVACHKLVVAVCLGVELAGSVGSHWKHVAQVALFAGGAAGGIGIGMGLVQIQDGWTQQGIPLLQAIAGGTLLYVTVCEVLPRERAKWHHRTASRAAGIIQFTSVVTGFGLILLLNFFFVHEHTEVQTIPGNN